MIVKLRYLLLVSLFASVCTVPPAVAGVSGGEGTQLRKAAQLLRSNQNQDALQAALAASPDGPRNLLAGEAAFRLKRYDEAIRYLSEAERSYPLLADVAAALKADALFSKKQYREAAAAAERAGKLTKTPSISRRMEKLASDALFEAGDLKAALAGYRQFAVRHTLGRDYLDALYQTAICHESAGDLKAAVQEYRTLYLQHPASAAAPKALDRLKGLEKKGVKGTTAFTAEEQFQRGQLLLVNNQPAAAGWAFAGIPRLGLSDELLARIELKSGQAAIKQRNYSLAEPFLKRAAAAAYRELRDEARLLLARVEGRQGETDRALARLLSLASERGPLADDALLEAALINKQQGQFATAAQLLQRLINEFPASDMASRAGWELAWGQYLAGNVAAAETAFRHLYNDSTYRERAIYWQARLCERQNKSADSAKLYKQLQQEYPFGFYAAWYRQRSGITAGWPSVGTGMPSVSLPDGSQRVQALAELGMLEEARAELSFFKMQVTDKGAAPAVSRLQQLAGDLHGSIMTFHQNRPATFEQNSIGFWTLGFPRPYAELFSRYSAASGLSDALVLSLSKAESSFRADVKSHAGAIGLMQLMPATARQTAGLKAKNFNPLSLTDPEFNIRLGTKHLRELFDQYNQDTVFTLAAYNAGAGAVNRWRKAFGALSRDEFVENIPYQETRDYVKKIIAYMPVYRALYRIH